MADAGEHGEEAQSLDAGEHSYELSVRVLHLTDSVIYFYLKLQLLKRYSRHKCFFFLRVDISVCVSNDQGDKTSIALPPTKM